MIGRKGQIVSRERVVEYGEVYTAEREVNAMLDLVKQQTVRIDARFLEPACGTGNFLTEVLRRKLDEVHLRYRRSQSEYERYAILAISSIYGIDKLPDNVTMCRTRLYEMFEERYHAVFRRTKAACKATARHILRRNIVCGDALTLTTADGPIVFSEWSLLGGRLKQTDYIFEELVSKRNGKLDISDLGTPQFTAVPVRTYPLVHFLKVGDAEQQQA